MSGNDNNLDKLQALEEMSHPANMMGVTEVIRDYCYHNISISLNSKYVEMIFCKHTAVTCHGMCSV